MLSSNFIAYFLQYILLTCLCFQWVKGQPVSPPDPPDVPDFQSMANHQKHYKFISDAMQIILKQGLFVQEHQICFRNPNQLEKMFNLVLRDQGTSHEGLLQVISRVFKLTSKPFDRFHLNRRVAGLDPLAVAGDWLAVTMSNLVVTYLTAPIWTMMEIKMTEYLSKKVGWERIGEGIPTSGSGSANSMALAVALSHLDQTFKDTGHKSTQKKLMVIASKHASTSWQTAAIYQGLGLESLKLVSVDSNGRMDVEKLKKCLESYKASNDVEAVMVVATAGTQLLGIIDDLKAIGELCKQYSVWFHVDAEKAGGFLFLEQNNELRKRLQGIEQAHSITVGTWLFATPYTSSMLLTQNPQALQSTFGLHASYVFTGIEIYNSSYDMGDHTIQTSRRPEIAKIWFANARGEKHNSYLFKDMLKMKTKFIAFLKKRDGFVIFNPFGTCEKLWSGVSTPEEYQLPQVSFFYIPKTGRSFYNDGKNITYNKELSIAMENLKYLLIERGLIDLSYSRLPDHKLEESHGFLTISFTNSRFVSDEFKYILDTIEQGVDGTLPELGLPVPAAKNKFNRFQLPNFPLESVYGDFMRKVFDLFLKEGIFFKRAEPTSKVTQPEDLAKEINFVLPMNPDGYFFENLLEQFKQIITYSPHWGHPYFIYQLAAGLDPYTLVADYVVPVLNSPMLSYTDSPIFTLMERQLVNAVLKQIYKSEVGDGIITDGGSMANQIPIALAKYRLHGEAVRQKGYKHLKNARYIVFTSEDAHYSTKKGSILQGIGQNNTIEIESNNIGQMKVDKLKAGIEKVMEEGNIPLMVVITAGTTIYGAIDPVEEIIKLCQQYDIWTHIDGMFGGLVALSNKHRHLFKGMEKADSFGGDLHKLFGSTMVCTIFITRHPTILHDTFAMDFTLSNQEEAYLKDVRQLNQVGRHWQMDKRNNMFKFWFLWKAKGRLGLEQHVDRIMENKDYLISELKKRKDIGFELVIDNFELTNVCFRFIPSNLNPMKSKSIERDTPEWNLSMNKLAFQIEKALLKDGVMNVVSQHRHTVFGNQDQVKFLKFVMMGSALTEPDINYLLDAVAYYGEKVSIDKKGKPVEDYEDNGDPFDPFGNLPKYFPHTAFK